MTNVIYYDRKGSNGPECSFSWDESGIKFSDEQQRQLSEELAGDDVKELLVGATSVKMIRVAKTWHSANTFERTMNAIARISGNELEPTLDANRTYETEA